MVEGVEHLRAELDPHSFGYVEGLDETEIDVPVIRCNENISSSTVLAGRWNTKRLRQVNATGQGVYWFEEYWTCKR